MATQYAKLWADLGAPIPRDLVKTRSQGGRQLSYITARTVYNRLDWVLGPENWWETFEVHDKYVICHLSIRLPGGEVITKSDAGGFAGMADEGDDAKSGFSDASKRAAAKFGIGRELYGDGNAVADLDRQPPPPANLSPGDAPHPSTGKVSQCSGQDRPAPSFGKPVDAVIAPQRDFDQWLRRSSEYAGQQQREQQERARVEATPSQFSPDDLAIYYCWRMQEAGVLDPSAYKVDGNVDHDAAIHVLREAWLSAPEPTGQQIRAIVEERIGRLISGQKEAGNRDRQQPANGSRGGQGNGNGGGEYGPPRNGRGLFAFAKDQGAKHDIDLVKYLNAWAKVQGFPARMVDFNEDQVAQAHAEAMRKIESLEPAMA